MAKQQLAALAIVLLAFLGPAACQLNLGLSITAGCLGPWQRIPILSLLCRRIRGPIPVLGSGSGSGLSIGYYNRTGSYSCPRAEGIVRNTVAEVIIGKNDTGMGAGLIRLFFHDCFVRGCDASVLLNTPDSESLRGFEVIDEAKTRLEQECPNKVSCADIVAFAARDPTYFLTGNKTFINMPAGRYDGNVSFANETLPNLPGPFSDLQDLKDTFYAKGLSRDDMVTLSGAHSIGLGQCRKEA
ncbi:hypothetical protein EJB05_10916, partial [Eragrostis curvula]